MAPHVRHRAQRGIADALRSGYLAARGEVLVFYPADLQFKPEDIPRLVQPILDGESDMVTGFKQGAYEKAFVSRIYNGLSRALFDVPVRDLNNVKAYRREIMDDQPVRPDWHRYMIVLAHAKGYTVTEIPVPLYPRHAGQSKFGIGRIPVGRARHARGLVRTALRAEAAARLRHARGRAVRPRRARGPGRAGRAARHAASACAGSGR
jgi:glycosyltransferase involved in cell wall biosynthesis